MLVHWCWWYFLKLKIHNYTEWIDERFDLKFSYIEILDYLKVGSSNDRAQNLCGAYTLFPRIVFACPNDVCLTELFPQNSKAFLTVKMLGGTKCENQSQQRWLILACNSPKSNSFPLESGSIQVLIITNVTHFKMHDVEKWSGKLMLLLFCFELVN